MILLLSSDKPWNTTYTTQSGQVLFRCESSRGRTSDKKDLTLYRTLAPSEIASSPYGTALGGDEWALRDQFEVIGRVEWDVWSSGKSKIRVGADEGPTMGGSEGVEAGEMFRKSGWGFYGSNRTFTAPDGREYTWKLGSSSCSLRQSSPKPLTSTPILTYKQATTGILSKPRSAYLEIQDGHENILPMLLLTFIYMEKVRVGREEMLEEFGGGV